MSLTIPVELLAQTKSEALKKMRNDHSENGRSWEKEVTIEVGMLSNDDVLVDIATAAKLTGHRKVEKAVESIRSARSGQFGKPIPNFKALTGVLTEYLRHAILDGWIYVRRVDGKLYPELVRSVTFQEERAHGRKADPFVSISTISHGFTENDRSARIGMVEHAYRITPQMAVNKRIPDILEAMGLFKETPELRKIHDASLERFIKKVQPQFAEQFRMDGVPLAYSDHDWQRRGAELKGRKVIHDVTAEEFGSANAYGETQFTRPDNEDGVGMIPRHPIVKVFDLGTHEFYWAHGDFLMPHEYDGSLRTKLVLPASHRDLLDVMTADIHAFKDDIIEGKNAGNVILCKGPPGVGKTLTAEVYSELIERPLYSIHSGNLGTSAAEVEKGLKTVFARTKRWNCVLLLDECDVFVGCRGKSIEQNAIVAEFLRTMEYFDGLLFMTTNRPDDIDDGILARCAAIINYEAPERKDAAAIWRVMSTQFQADLSDSLVEELLNLFPKIVPRDIKMLLRLVIRVAKSQSSPIDLQVFRQCAMFRAISMAEGSTAQAAA